MEQAEKDPAQVLEDAADLLLIHGRCVGVPQDERGRLCVRGAIAVARGVNPLDPNEHGFDPASVALERHLAAEVFPSLTFPWDPDAWRNYVDEFGALPAYAWNDLRTTTDDDVRDHLLLTAKDLRNEAAQ